MRVSTQSFYDQSKSAMGSLQSNLLRTQQQLGAGTRILAPSDDPLGATRALSVSQSIALNAQYAASRAHTTQTLSMEENALKSVTDVLQDVKTQLIQAGGPLTDADRGTIATTLQSSLDQLQGLANTDDGNGQFLFAGFKSGTAPFVRQSDGSISYVGDQGQRLMQVDVSRQMAGTDDGRTIFQNAGTDVFATLNTVIAALKTPGVNASALGKANREITTAHDNVLTVRSSVGSRLQELDALGVTGDNRTLSDKSYLSDLQDLDYGSTIAEFYQRQTALQASQQTFIKIQQIALFNYL
jgi:flagellar hook-associated protein 3 FlgL